LSFVGQRPCRQPSEEQTLPSKENLLSGITKHWIHKWPPPAEVSGPPETLQIRFKRLYLNDFVSFFPLSIVPQEYSNNAQPHPKKIRLQQPPDFINWQFAIDSLAFSRPQTRNPTHSPNETIFPQNFPQRKLNESLIRNYSGKLKCKSGKVVFI